MIVPRPLAGEQISKTLAAHELAITGLAIGVLAFIPMAVLSNFPQLVVKYQYYPVLYIGTVAPIWPCHVIEQQMQQSEVVQTRIRLKSLP